MAERLPRLCIFGDSHYACLRQAEAQGLVDVSGVDLEYWGHVGTRFRYLAFRDGAIHPLDDFTARRFAKFNARGRTFLPAADFDVIHVTGARVYVWGLFVRLLGALAEGPFVSSGLARRMLSDGLRGQSGYRLAAGLAATGTARVLLSPVAFYTAIPPARAGAISPAMAGLIPDRLPRFWEILEEVAAADGIRLLRQPAETVTAGLFTDPAYAVADHLAKADYEHRNAAYGALLLARAVALARQG
ncbi:hypothetical protein [Rhodobacter calidifons]|uniref:Uncharacterized protein n=1 Tax=Rhodobacter calidifons TaxID=2715277 RepID=A0ABX0G5W0_9RHOB|nr:hypothetical protein [Rhodobacter calidifons]NHB76569.1 hypothetical protein [Rhodobacter calidifons]